MLAPHLDRLFGKTLASLLNLNALVSLDPGREEVEGEEGILERRLRSLFIAASEAGPIALSGTGDDLGS